MWSIVLAAALTAGSGIPQGSALLARPTVGADGTVVVVRFEEGSGRLLLVPPDGAPRTLGPEALDLRDPAFASEHAIVAVARDDEGDQLWRIDIDGDAAPVAFYRSEPGVHLSDPAVLASDDGPRVVFGACREATRRGQVGSSRLLSLEPGGQVIALDEGRGDRHDPAFLADGRIVFVHTEGSYARLMLLRPGGGDARELMRFKGTLARPVPLDGAPLRFVAALDAGSGPKLVLIEPERATSSALAAGPHPVTDPTPLPGGTALLAVSASPRGHALIRIDLDEVVVDTP